MVGSVVVNGVMGFVYCILLLFSASSLDLLLSTPTGFPFMQIYLDATQSRAGATVMSVMVILIATAATIAGTMSTSRTLWAFARDKATPFDEYLSHVSPTKQIPVRAIVVVTALQGLLGLIYLGNVTAFNAILSMAIIGLYLSYSLPIFYMLFYGRQSLREQDYGPFRLKPLIGIVLNVISLIWMVVVMVFSTFPTTIPVTAQNMNYSIVVMVGWVAFGAAYYVLVGRYKFVVPMTDVCVIRDIQVPSASFEKGDSMGT